MHRLRSMYGLSWGVISWIICPDKSAQLANIVAAQSPHGLCVSIWPSGIHPRAGGERVRYWPLAALSALGAGLVYGVGLHVPRLPQIPTPSLAQSRAEAEARLQAWDAAATGPILPVCRSRIWGEQRTAVRGRVAARLHQLPASISSAGARTGGRRSHGPDPTPAVSWAGQSAAARSGRHVARGAGGVSWVRYWRSHTGWATGSRCWAFRLAVCWPVGPHSSGPTSITQSWRRRRSDWLRYIRGCAVL